MSVPSCTPTPSEPDAPAAGGELILVWARLARFVAELFAEPGECQNARLAEPGLCDELAAAAGVAGIPGGLLLSALRRVRNPDALRCEHQALFGHTVRSACPPYELEYGRTEVFQQSQMLADVAGFYRAFGVEPAGMIAERADHVASQWEFLALLAAMQWRAALAGDEGGAAVCRDAQAAFLRDHAAAWMPALFARIRKHSPDSAFAAAADAAEAVLRAWCARLDVTLGEPWIELRMVTDEDVEISCGAPGAAAVELGPKLSAALQAGG